MIQGRVLLRLTSALALLAAAVMLPAQTGQNADYWPMKAGNSWALAAKAGGQEIITTFKVDKVEGDVATLSYSANNRVVQIEKYRRTPKALLRIAGGANGSSTFTPPMPLMQLPLKSGQKWEWSGTIQLAPGSSVKGSSTFSVSGPVTVKTPAGTFQALKVHSDLTIEAQGQKQKFPNDYWFAAGVGLVQQYAELGPTPIDAKLTKYTVKR
jgi:hypothetical protein